jgi:hypothetical protein
VWFEVSFDVECRAAEQVSAVCGAETADLADIARPSVIIRAAGEQETLWSIAKACRSTEEAILQANHLTEEDAIGGRMLLIPLVS